MKIIFQCICGNQHVLTLDDLNCNTIGCEPEPNGLNLCRDEQNKLSRRQAYIKKEGNNYNIYDGCPADIPFPEGKNRATSAMGTFINRDNKIQRISEEGAKLKSGDIISFVPVGTTGDWQGLVKGTTITHFLYSGRVIGGEEIDNFSEQDVEKFIAEIQQRGNLIDLDPASDKVKKKFGDLYDLMKSLSTPELGLEGKLKMALDYIHEKIPSANAIAVLEIQPDNIFKSIFAKVGWKHLKDDFKFSTTVTRRLLKTDRPVLTKNIKECIGFTQSIKLLGQSVIAIPLYESDMVTGVLWLDNRGKEKPFSEEDFYLSCAVAGLVQLQIVTERQKKFKLLEANMKRFFSPATLEWVRRRTKAGKDVKLDVTERDVTIIFIDITDSTKISKSITAKQFFEFLTPHYYKIVSEAVFSEGGHINSFIGDGVMATFGNVVGDEDRKETMAEYAEAAIKSALKIVNIWPSVKKKHGLPENMDIRIGIHTGRAVVGNIGYEKRMEFSALGKDVNLASRLEKFADRNGIVISQPTYKCVEGKFNCEEIGDKEIKGITDADEENIKLWKVISSQQS